MLHYIQLSAKDQGKNPDDAKLWFYGISYGTILGPTFASLYPEKVERMILDGVLELEDHYKGAWEKSLANSDEAARFWFKRCFEAGPQICAFHQNATSWEEIEQRYWSLFNDLKDNPIGLGDPISQDVIDSAKEGTIVTPHVFTWQDLVNQFFSASYIIAPLFYSLLDKTLVELQTGNYSQLQFVAIAATISTFAPVYDDRMSRTLINCLDANGRSNYTEFGAYKDFVNSMASSSAYAGLKVATFSGPICSQLNLFPPESQAFDGIPRVEGRKLPILFVSGIADPITPLPSAERMQTYFPSSGLLKWNNSGSQSSCATTVLSNVAVPSGTTLDLSSLADGTTVIFEGTTSWGCKEWKGPLLDIRGNKITVKGAAGSVLNGDGARWWDGEGGNGGKIKPKFFSAHTLTDSSITGITIKNPPVQVVSINGCDGLTITDMTIDASEGDEDEQGHNTDGFDIGSSSNVVIDGAVKVYNQDDCVAVNSGTDITFKNGFCSGGHGLSIGSVGGRDDNMIDTVTFSNSEVTKSVNRVRVKASAGVTG
ncbi:Glyco-hydro-28 multi-domain protein [Pyrenophora tritici-repentis]|nr:Glyco-hydro-28 multi-domain protein [Pyrenophora tritici-repentis]